MKIKAIQAVRLNLPPAAGPKTQPRHPSWTESAEVANPMSRFPNYKRHRSSWLPRWETVHVKVTAEDGTWGLGQTSFGRATAAVIEDHFAPVLTGESCFAIEKVWDMMFRMSKPYGSAGIAACAMSGVDLALWDLVGKLKGQPVYALLGGPSREKVLAYATGNDVDWYRELGFRAFKLACPYGPADGLRGLDQNERFVAEAREKVGDGADLMLDCYMAFDVEYTIRLAERLRPYRLRWIEEFLIPEDIEGHAAVRRAVTWTGLASGEHLYTPWPFRQLIERRCLDILQPDIHWVGGLTACVKIAHMAEAAGLTVMLHGGGSAYGLHFTAAMPNTPWAECFIGSAPGIPLEEVRRFPGSSIPREGEIRPNEGPGFGIDVKEEWLTPFF